MNKAEVNKLELGLYVILWKQGGISLASVGQMEGRMKWLAPCNWIRPTTTDTVIECWEMVESAHLIYSLNNLLSRQ